MDEEAYILKANTVKIRTWRLENGAALGVVRKAPERPTSLLNPCTLLPLELHGPYMGSSETPDLYWALNCNYLLKNIDY
jgi:hypothetical protein